MWKAARCGRYWTTLSAGKHKTWQKCAEISGCLRSKDSGWVVDKTSWLGVLTLSHFQALGPTLLEVSRSTLCFHLRNTIIHQVKRHLHEIKGKFKREIPLYSPAGGDFKKFLYHDNNKNKKKTQIKISWFRGEKFKMAAKKWRIAFCVSNEMRLFYSVANP